MQSPASLLACPASFSSCPASCPISGVPPSEGLVGAPGTEVNGDPHPIAAKQTKTLRIFNTTHRPSNSEPNHWDKARKPSRTGMPSEALLASFFEVHT